MTQATATQYDAFLLVSYGAPECPEEVEPFLDRVLAGKRVPEARRRAVAEKYREMDGYSPLNDQCRRFIAQWEKRIADLPVKTYWGNLYSPPFIADTVERIRRDGVRNVLMLATSPFGSVPGCRRYWDAVGAHWPEGVGLTKIPPFYNDSQYRKAVADRILRCCADAILDRPVDFASAESGTETLFLFAAHALPEADARSARYIEQLKDHCSELYRMIHADSWRELGGIHWDLAFQSRSGRPSEPWTGPDIFSEVEAAAQKSETVPANEGLKRVIVAPVGFMFENFEIIRELDVDLRRRCDELGLRYYRAQTAGTDTRTIEMCARFLDRAPESFPHCDCRPETCDFSCANRINLS